MSAKYNQCRYLKQHTDERCTGEAVDPAPDALIVLCTRHLALALELVREARRQKAA